VCFVHTVTRKLSVSFIAFFVRYSCLKTSTCLRICMLLTRIYGHKRLVLGTRKKAISLFFMGEYALTLGFSSDYLDRARGNAFKTDQGYQNHCDN
jgi:hypothetical protein